MFDGVERVYIYVDYKGGMDEKKIPEALKREHLEKLLFELYSQRFSSKDCQKILGGRNPYSCNNQPIKIIPVSDASNFKRRMNISVATQEKLCDPNTLIIIFKVNIIQDAPADCVHCAKWFDPPLDTPLVAYSFHQERFYSPIGLPCILDLTSPFAFPINQKNEKINENIVSFIKNRIR